MMPAKDGDSKGLSGAQNSSDGVQTLFPEFRIQVLQRGKQHPSAARERLRKSWENIQEDIMFPAGQEGNI